MLMFESKDYVTISEEEWDEAEGVAMHIAKDIESNLKKEFDNAKVDYDLNTDEEWDDDAGYVTIKRDCEIKVSIPLDEIDKNLNIDDLTDTQIYDLGEKYIIQYCIPELYKNTEYNEEKSIDSIFVDGNQFTFSMYYTFTYVDNSNYDDRDEYPDVCP